MAAPATGTALLIFVAFVLPGFVTILVKERLYEVAAEQQAFERLLQTLYYSLLVYSAPTLVVGCLSAAGVLDRADLRAFVQGRASLWLTTLVAVTVLFLLPVAIAYLGRRWLGSEARTKTLTWLGMSLTHRTPSSWDFAFEDEEPCLMVVSLRGGDKVAGYYGPRSHSGYGGRQRDLFLEERWEIVEQGGTIQLEQRPNSLGVWLAAEDIVAYDRYAVSDAQYEDLRNEG